MPVEPQTAAHSTSASTDTLSTVPRQRSAEPELVVDRDEQRWVARPAAARLVQLAVLTVPVTASVCCAWALSVALPHAASLPAALLWWFLVLAGSTATLVVVDRVARHALPLAVLLRLSMLFPDQAPKRYRVAVRAWSTRDLLEQVEAGNPVSDAGAPVEAATEILRLLASLAMHDRATRGHCERVRAYNDLLAEELGLSRPDRDRLRWAALIHDIGKLEVPRRLLNKPGKPTQREWSVLRAHPARGARIAEPLADWLGPWAAAIEHHHERWDGAGYPHGLAGTDISLGGRIVAVADAFEVMTSMRPYSRAVSRQSARTELAACAGTHFDPVVVRAFLNISIGKLRKAMGPIAWCTQVPFLASMPRLEAAIIGGGQAAVAAGGTAGVVAATTLAPGAAVAGHHHHHDASPAPRSHPVVAAPFALRLPGQPQVSDSDPRPAAGHHGAHPRAAAVDLPAARRSPAAEHVQASSHAPVKQHRRRAGGTTEQPAASGGNTSGGRCAGNAGIGLGNGGPEVAGLRPGARQPDRAAKGTSTSDAAHSSTMPRGTSSAQSRLAHDAAAGLTACD